jgi:hypothetical protein
VLSDPPADLVARVDGAHHLSTCVSLLARLALGFSGMEEPELLRSSSDVLFRLITVFTDAFRLYKWDLANLSLARCRMILPALQHRIPEFADLPPHLSEALQAPTRPESRMGIVPSNSSQTGMNESHAYNSFGIFEGRPPGSANQMGFDLSSMHPPTTEGPYNPSLLDVDWRTMGLADNMEGWMPLDVGLGLGEIGVLFKGQNGFTA